MAALADTEKSESVEGSARKEGAGRNAARAARREGLRRVAELAGAGNPALAEIDARIKRCTRRLDRLAQTIEKEMRDGARMTGGRAIALRAAVDAVKAGLAYAQQERAACFKGRGDTGLPARLCWEDGTRLDDKVSPERVAESAHALFVELGRSRSDAASEAAEIVPPTDDEVAPVSLSGAATTVSTGGQKSYPTLMPMGRSCGVGRRGEALGASWSRGVEVSMQASCLD